MQYISPEDYAIAERNGLSKELVYQRVYLYDWDVNTAITMPKRIRKDRGDWMKVALSNGIKPNTFYGRLSRGWDIEKAASAALVSHKESIKKAHDSKRGYPKEYGLLADANGISRTGFRERLKRGWTLEDAATYPVMQKGERRATRDALLNQRGL